MVLGLLRAMFRLECVIILGFPPVAYPSSNWAGICVVPMADAVVAGKVGSFDSAQFPTLGRQLSRGSNAAQ